MDSLVGTVWRNKENGDIARVMEWMGSRVTSCARWTERDLAYLSTHSANTGSA